MPSYDYWPRARNETLVPGDLHRRCDDPIVPHDRYRIRFGSRQGEGHAASSGSDVPRRGRCNPGRAGPRSAKKAWPTSPRARCLQRFWPARPIITDEGVEAVAKAKKLTLLYASGPFSRRSLEALARCTDLHTFLLEGMVDLGDDDLDLFSSFKTWRYVTVNDSRISKEGEARVKAMLPRTRVSF